MLAKLTCQPVFLIFVLGIEDGFGDLWVERVANGGQRRRNIMFNLDVERRIVARPCEKHQNLVNYMLNFPEVRATAI